MWKFILNLVTGGFAKAVLDAASSMYIKYKDTDVAKLQAATGATRDVAIAQIQAQVAANAAAKAQAEMYFGWGPTRWLMWTCIACAVLHQSIIFIDSSCPAASFRLLWLWDIGGRPHGGCGLGIPPAPGEYAGREWLIIATLLGIQKVPETLNALARAIGSIRR